jgi:AcrR family transcriptional regulator
MTEAAAPGIRKLRAAQTETALKEAAKRVFARSGYLTAKITDITAEAGRAAGSFYSHFASKENLLEALLVDLLADVDETTQASTGHSDDFTDPAAIRWHVAAFWDFFRANRPVMVALQQASMVDERFARRMHDLVAADIDHLATHLAHIPAAGGTLPGDPRIVASAIGALLWQFTYTWLVTDDTSQPISDDEAIDTLTRLIQRGIGG